jgi:hypothetical protein
LNKNLVKAHSTSKQEICDLEKIIEREINDANVQAISNDRRFACSYNEALQLGHIVLATDGYRTNAAMPGHHKTTFAAVELIMGASVSQLTAYFEVCRRKRNSLDYSVSGSINASEVKDIQKSVLQFRRVVESWLSRNHPNLI